MRTISDTQQRRVRTPFWRTAVAGVAFIGATIGLAGTADAACRGNGVNFNSTAGSGAGWARESSNVSTCDGLNDYFGTIQDIAADGWKVRVETQWINGNGGWVPTANTGGTLAYNYGDNNSTTTYRMVRADGLTAASGTNWGF